MYPKNLKTNTTQMKDKPILFSSEMVRAIKEGRKTMTRRVIKEMTVLSNWYFDYLDDQAVYFKDPRKIMKGVQAKYPYEVGQKLWVRETFSTKRQEDGVNFYTPTDLTYKADPETYSHFPDDTRMIWTPSIFMPRELSRITLEVTDFRFEPLDDIWYEDAVDEGVAPIEKGSHLYKNYLNPESSGVNAIHSFSTLWDSINGKGAFAQNPWVWVIEFKVL